MFLVNERLLTLVGQWWPSDHVGVQSRPYHGRSDSESRFFQERLRYLEVPVVNLSSRCLVVHLILCSPWSSGATHHYCRFRRVM
jgi:hypothetical protein